MFHRKTLFVIGAGASAEVEFPIGIDLAKLITAKMDIRFERGHIFIGSGDEMLFNHIRHVRRADADDWQGAALRIRDGLPFAQSIDDFLDQRRTDSWINLYGKTAIVRAIVDAERKSKLFFDPFSGDDPFDPGQLADTWFVKLMYLLSRGVTREDVGRIFDNVHFIVFNYDRCLEFFLISALERAYSIRREDAVHLVDNLNILHPYGLVGSLREVQFGAERVNCVQVAEKIKTYTEQTTDRPFLDSMCERVEWAECVVFLGFAYHRQNMQLLHVANRSNKLVYGTAYRMSDPDVIQATIGINRAFSNPGQIHLENNLTSGGLFDHYGKSLTGGD